MINCKRKRWMSTSRSKLEDALLHQTEKRKRDKTLCASSRKSVIKNVLVILQGETVPASGRQTHTVWKMMGKCKLSHFRLLFFLFAIRKDENNNFILEKTKL